MSTAVMPLRRSTSCRISSVHGSAPKMPISRLVLARVDALGLHLVEDRQEVRRGHHDDPRLEVHDQLHLPLGHAAADRDDRAAQPLGAVVRAEPAGEQPVAVGHVHRSPGRPPAALIERAITSAQVSRSSRGVAHDGRLARRTAGGVHAADLLARHREHAERVVRAQVGLGGEREPRQVGQRLRSSGVTPGGVEGAPVVRHVLVDPLERVAQPLQLQRLELAGVASGIPNPGVEPAHPPPSAPG